MGTGKVKSVNSQYSYVSGSEFLKINLKIRSSDVFKDGEPPEDAEDPEEEAKKLKFPWHAEKGIIENIRLLNIEFNKDRGLNPVKIFITGPPASGKTFYADRLA
jgi:SpoVK/Ycf46/Vps4 family AAA+-type ATPase